jgi:hypothetical protein
MSSFSVDQIEIVLKKVCRILHLTTQPPTSPEAREVGFEDFEQLCSVLDGVIDRLGAPRETKARR